MPAALQHLQKAGIRPAHGRPVRGVRHHTVYHVKAPAARHLFCVYTQFMTAPLSHLWLSVIILISIKIFILN